MPPPAIEVLRLRKRYGDIVAVDGLDLAIPPGETFALLGPNGAGKTTTVELMEGYRHPDGGSVRVLGLDPVADARRVRPRVGLMLQEGGIYPAATPRELLRLFAAFYRDPLPPHGLLERVGIAGVADRRVRELSGGQRQRLSLALAVVGRPEVVFLDEPTAGLDPGARRRTWDHIRELRAEGATVLLTTHLLDEAEELADRIGILDGGRLVALGTPDELTHGSRAPEVSFTARPGLDVLDLSAAVGAPVAEERPGRYRVHAGNTPSLVARLARWLEVHDVALGELRAGKASLEDVFLRLTEEGGSEADGTPRAGQAGPVRVERA